MIRLRFWQRALLAAALFMVAVQAGRSQTLSPSRSYIAEPMGVAAGSALTALAAPTCVVYSLADLGDDTELAQWIAETIPEVIEPGTWNQKSGKSCLRYYAPKRVLVVYHRPDVHAKVECFLKKMKGSVGETPRQCKVSAPACVTIGAPPSPFVMSAPARHKAPKHMQIEYREPALIRTATAPPEVSYPVPAPARPPKHLFHFIIRYEGDGVIDDNVAKIIKAQYDKSTKEDKESDSDKPSVRSTLPAPVTEPVSAPSVVEKKDKKPEEKKDRNEKDKDKKDKDDE